MSSIDDSRVQLTDEVVDLDLEYVIDGDSPERRRPPASPEIDCEPAHPLKRLELMPVHRMVAAEPRHEHDWSPLTKFDDEHRHSPCGHPERAGTPVSPYR